jgi:hypothetical protein
LVTSPVGNTSRSLNWKYAQAHVNPRDNTVRRSLSRSRQAGKHRNFAGCVEYLGDD